MQRFELIILRGASGVGKTSLLQTLKEMINQSFCIDIDSIRGMLSKMDWQNGFNDYVNSHKIVLAMIREIKMLGYERVIVADTFPYDLLYTFLSKCSCHNRIVNLYCNQDELMSRLRQRGNKIVRMNRTYIVVKYVYKNARFGHYGRWNNKF